MEIVVLDPLVFPNYLIVEFSFGILGSGQSHSSMVGSLDFALIAF